MVRASDYVKRPSPTAISTKRRKSIKEASTGGLRTHWMRRLLSTIAVAALCILVWLNVHVKTSSHSAHAAEHEEHAERGTMQFLHRIFGEDLGKMHEDGFSREAWSKAHHAAKEANRNEQAPNSIANLREDGHPSLDSLGSEMRHVMHDVVERTKKLKFSIPLREHNILGTRSDIKGSLSLHNVGAEDGEVGGKARVGAAANGSGYLDNAKWIQDLVAATYPQGYRAPVTIHKESEFADDPTVRTAPRGDSSSERAAADTVPAAQTVSGFLDSSQWVKNLVEATYPEGSEQWTAKHPKHEEREDQHEGEHVVVGGFLENTKWIQDLIEATYPDGYDASPTMSDHDGEEPADADADANADFGGTAKVASPRGGYLDSSEWIQKIVDATYVDGHEHKNAQAQARENTQQLQHKVDEGSQDDNVTQLIESKSKGEGEAGDYHGSHVGGAAHLALEAARDAAEASHHTAAKAEAEVTGEADHSLEDTHDSGDAGGSRAIRTRMLSDVRRKLREHPLHKLKGKRAAGDVRIDSQLYEVLPWLQNRSQCKNKPIFLSMANVADELYWQLIENYLYTLVKFGMSDCAIMVCVDDSVCMEKCAANDFPCYRFSYLEHHAKIPEIKELGVLAGSLQSKDSKEIEIDPAGPSVMELIAYLKLYHIPRALKSGVGSVVVLDLDVGFLESPQNIVDYLYNTRGNIPTDGTMPRRDYNTYNTLDVMTQQDVTFMMNRTVAGWKQWWTEPMPNIGVLLLKASPKVDMMFSIAWRDYLQTAQKAIRKNPGKDQNKVVLALHKTGGSGTGFGSDTSSFNHMPGQPQRKHLQWRYIPVSEAVLIDKLFKFNNQAIELGGRATLDILHPPQGGAKHMDFMFRNEVQGTQGAPFIGPVPKASVVHVTCFEQRTKLFGLKAASAFWNPFYYDPDRPTITKRLVGFNRQHTWTGPGGAGTDRNYIDTQMLMEEVQSLVYLAIKLNRTLIIPNLLLEPASGSHREVLYHTDPQKSNVIQRPEYKGKTMWPGFRVLWLASSAGDAHSKTVLQVKQVEPAYYWRVEKDYEGEVPDPTVVSFTAESDLDHIYDTLSELTHEAVPRLVLHMLPQHDHHQHKQHVYISTALSEVSRPTQSEIFVQSEQAIQVKWAEDSVGYFNDDWQTEHNRYVPLPSMHSIEEKEKTKGYSDMRSAHTSDPSRQNSRERAYINALRTRDVVRNMRLCSNIGERMRGNRSCFGKCA